MMFLRWFYFFYYWFLHFRFQTMYYFFDSGFKDSKTFSVSFVLGMRMSNGRVFWMTVGFGFLLHLFNRGFHFPYGFCALFICTCFLQDFLDFLRHFLSNGLRIGVFMLHVDFGISQRSLPSFLPSL